MNCNLKAIIFDMDGVLIDSPQHWRQVSKNFLVSKIPDWTDDHSHKIMGLGSQDLFQILQNKSNNSFTREEFEDFSKQAAQEIYEHRIRLLPGVEELLNDLKNHQIPTGLASSAKQSWIDIVIERFNLRAFFQTIMSDDNVQNSKPAPDIFLNTANQLDVSASQCLVIEDSLNGISAAKAAGMYCLAVANTIPAEKLTKADLIKDNLLGVDWQFLTDNF